MFPSHNSSKLKSELSMLWFRTGLSRKAVCVLADEITDMIEVLSFKFPNCASFRAATLPEPRSIAVCIVRPQFFIRFHEQLARERQEMHGHVMPDSPRQTP